MESAAKLGLRNKIINGAFQIKQWPYTSGAATTAGQYVIDRWKVTGTGGITFSTVNNKTTVTIPTGQTLQQVIEGLNLETGIYVLSWEGTAQGRIAGGAYGSSGSVNASITGGVNTTIEFGPGTVTKVQLELGLVPTPYEWLQPRSMLRLCQEYVEVGHLSIAGYGVVSEPFGIYAPFKVTKRATPTITLSNILTTNGTNSGPADISVNGFYAGQIGTGSFRMSYVADFFAVSELSA